VHEDITTWPLPFSRLQIILSFWGIVNMTCFLVPAGPCLPFLGFSEAIMIGKWAQQVQITQDRNHGIICHWWNFRSHSWDCFPQVPNYRVFKFISCQIKGILLYQEAYSASKYRFTVKKKNWVRFHIKCYCYHILHSSDYFSTYLPPLLRHLS